MKPLVLLFTLFLVLPSFAAETTGDKKADEPEQVSPPEKSTVDKARDKVNQATTQVVNALNEGRERRGKSSFFVLASYSPFDLIIPSKYGLTLGYIQDADRTWELEYLKGSVSVPFIVKDLGEMKDERLSLIKRSYYGGNSFNFGYGLSYHRFSISLGDDMLSRVSGGSYPSIDLLEIQTLGFYLGVGNRWVLDHGITLGVDWFSWSQPVYELSRKDGYLDYATNEEDRKNADNALKLVTYFPRFAVFKMQAGITF